MTLRPTKTTTTALKTSAVPPIKTIDVFTSGSADEQEVASVTDSDTAATFDQQVKSYFVYNDGPNAVHYKRDAAATTSNFKIPAKAWLMDDIPVTALHFICASGETATVYAKGNY